MLLAGFLCLQLSNLTDNDTVCWASCAVSVSGPQVLPHGQHLFQEQTVLILLNTTELYEGFGTNSTYCKSCFRVTSLDVRINLSWHALNQTVQLGFYLKSTKHSIAFRILLIKRLTTFWVCSKLTAFSDNEEVNSFLDFQKQRRRISFV